MSGEPPNEDDRVGYRRPPTQSRFRKGRSGNPRGRQKGVRNFPADIKRALETPVTINDKGKAKRVSTQKALILRLRERALNGNPRALDSLLALAGTHNSADGDQAVGGPTAAEDQAILDAFAESVRAGPPVAIEPSPATSAPPVTGEDDADG
jgi:Family of unknown function (DUF5681)